MHLKYFSYHQTVKLITEKSFFSVILQILSFIGLAPDVLLNTDNIFRAIVFFRGNFFHRFSFSFCLTEHRPQGIVERKSYLSPTPNDDDDGKKHRVMQRVMNKINIIM